MLLGALKRLVDYSSDEVDLGRIAVDVIRITNHVACEEGTVFK
jgi:hypothetical protein